MVPKAELHVHIEGTAPPYLLQRIAERNGLRLNPAIIKSPHTFQWGNFANFLKTYDIACEVLRTPDDFRDITFHYLEQCAASQTLYVEMTYSPDHGKNCGLSHSQLLAGLTQGMDEARDAFGIESRLIAVCVRHYGLNACHQVAELVANEGHPYVVGFGMAGDEVNYPAKQFSKTFEIAASAGLACTAHAGEAAGPDSVWQAIEYLPVTRIGHGVRSIEDPKLIETLAKRQIALEVCPGSNVALGVYPDLASHPLPQLIAAGIPVSLNSDDPPYFNTTLAQEYQNAQTVHGLSDKQLLSITQQAIKDSFAPPDLKAKLLKKLAI